MQTARLDLRLLDPRDLDALAAMYADPETRRFFPDGTRTREQTERELAHFSNGHPRHPHLGLWATVERETGRLVGRCGLLPWRIDGRDEVELAYLIERPRWGRGYGTEAALAIAGHACKALQISRLIALFTPGNAASVRVARKVGNLAPTRAPGRLAAYWRGRLITLSASCGRP